MESPWESLQAWHVGESLHPGGAPVNRGMTHLGFAGCSACGVACILSGVFEGVGVPTAATFDARKFSGGGEVFAVMAAGQMPGGPVVGDHL